MMMHNLNIKDAQGTHLVDQYNIISTNMMVSEPTTAYSPVDTFNEAGAI